MVDQIPPAIREKLLQDPQVKAAISKAGEDALKNPEVQKMIIEAAKKEGPEIANKVKGQVLQWANDPEIQAQARKYGTQALAAGAAYAGQAGGQFMSQLEQGPAGVRLLATVGGIGSCVWGIRSIINPFSAAFAIASYIINVYIVFFSLTTILFEMPQTWADKLGPVTKYHDVLIRKAAFLCELEGRGAFYIFIGCLWMTQAGLTAPVTLALSLYMLFIGVLHLLMRAGYTPAQIGKGMKDGYSRVRGSVDTGAASP